MPRPLPLHDQPLPAQAVILGAEPWRQIQRISADAAPLEGCGLLVGRDDRIVEVVVAHNVHPEPRTRYALDPRVFLDLEERLEGTGQQIVGVVHSHPHSDAVPSDTDRQHAVPGAVYLIHGFPPARPEGILRAWRLSEGGQFLEVPLIWEEKRW